MANNPTLSRRTTMKAICGAIGGGALIGRFKLKKDDVESVLDSRLERSKTKLRRKEKTNPSPHSDGQVERRDKVSGLSGGYEVTETEFANVDSDSDNPWWIPGGRTSTDTNVDDSAYGGQGQTDRVEARCRSSAAGVVSCYSQGYDRWTSIEDEVSVEYEGDYVADVGNLFGSSELTMRLYIKDADFNLTRNSPALQHSSSIAGIRGYDDDYDQGLYISNYADDEVYIGMKVYCGAVAVGTSTATINALTDPDNPTPGHFGLDNFYLKTE